MLQDYESFQWQGQDQRLENFKGRVEIEKPSRASSPKFFLCDLLYYGDARSVVLFTLCVTDIYFFADIFLSELLVM